MIQFRKGQYVVDVLNKKNIPFEHKGTHIEVQEEDLTEENFYLLQRYMKGDKKRGRKPVYPPEERKPKIQRPPAVYSNPQWDKLYEI